MAQITAITQRRENMSRLLAIWESAVRETHTFLQEADILSIKQDVPQALQETEHLYAFVDDAGEVRGFVGVEQNKIEMLFVDAEARGQGIGKRLLQYALTDLGAIYVDVNEQNEQATGFYEHMGFFSVTRSDCDAQGRPFPVLHLKLRQF